MDSLQYEKFKEVLIAMEENEEDLSDFETSFLDSMQKKEKEYGQMSELTMKQAEVLVKIAQKLEIDAEILL
jgi:SAM-dependent MidA family methyltransferase